jgi:hypothetical protein
MKKLSLVLLVLLAAALSTSMIAVFAQAATSSWSFVAEVTPRRGPVATHDLLIPLAVMDKSRADLTDLRLYSANGREIPYALRILRQGGDKARVAATVFNQARIGSASEISIDLGENVGEHNEVEVDTAGTNFRRRVDVEGSESGKEWRALKTDVIFGFEGQNRMVESKAISYPTSRYRYLRVRVFADELTDKEGPFINGVTVLMSIRAKGELAAWNVAVPPYQLLRHQGAPAAAWTIDLGGRGSCDRLTLTVDDDSFSRPFQLEQVDDPQNSRLLASGELTRRAGEPQQPLLIIFDNEVHVRKLRLLITDNSNQTLSISSIQAGAPARQLIFELKETDGQPLRLFAGNSGAAAPHYDFEKALPATFPASAPQPARSELGPLHENPDYKPEPLPLTERIPWLIYLVLAASSIALGAILISLARTTLRTKPPAGESPELQAGSG